MMWLCGFTTLLTSNVSLPVYMTSSNSQPVLSIVDLFSKQENNADGIIGEQPNSGSAHAVSPISSSKLQSTPEVQEKTKDPLLDNQEAMGQIESRSNSSDDDSDRKDQVLA